MKAPTFLTLAEVIEIHRNQIELYGGTLGVRYMALLESALAQPEASFASQWLHPGLYEMAAAYAYHICMNHPFLDGNKRVALASCLIFLEMNRVSLLDPEGILLNAVLNMASGKVQKAEFAGILRKLPTE